MFLNEIESIDFISKSNATFTTLKKDWTAMIKRFKPQLLGTIGQFRLASVDGNLIGSTPYKIVVAYDLKMDQYAAFLQLDTFSKGAYAESVIAADKAYRGINLPLQMYSFLIKEEGIIIVSDEIQTMGARSIWEKLAKEPGIDVHGYNTETKKVFQIDADDLFNEDIYDTELNAKKEQMEAEYEDTWAEYGDQSHPAVKKIQQQIEQLEDQIRNIKNHVRLFAARAR